jgi:hypothetical protein
VSVGAVTFWRGHELVRLDVRRFDELSPSEQAGVEAAYERIAGEPPGPRVGARLGLMFDGSAVGLVKRPCVPARELPPAYQTATAFDPAVHESSVIVAACRSESSWLPLEQAIPILRDPHGDEAEVARREELLRGDRERTAATVAKLQAEQTRLAAEREAEHRFRQAMRPEQWDALSTNAAILLAVAAQIDGGKEPAAALRAIAAQLRYEDARPGLPTRKWWIT